MREQPGDAVLDQVDARRFERFEETRGEPERNDIGVPCAPPHPGAEAQRSGFGERAPFDMGEQGRGRFILADEVAAKDMAVAGAVLERDAPLRSEEHTSELQSLMRISYAVFCLKKKK